VQSPHPDNLVHLNLSLGNLIHIEPYIARRVNGDSAKQGVLRPRGDRGQELLYNSLLRQ
jgi:hypothetical protein